MYEIRSWASTGVPVLCLYDGMRFLDDTHATMGSFGGCSGEIVRGKILGGELAGSGLAGLGPLGSPVAPLAEVVLS